MNAACARPRHQKHAAKPDADSSPAPPVNPFAKHRAAECRHDEWRAEDDRHRLIELEITQSDEIERRRYEQQRRASKLQPWPPCAHHLWLLDRIKHEQRK